MFLVLFRFYFCRVESKDIWKIYLTSRSYTVYIFNVSLITTDMSSTNYIIIVVVCCFVAVSF
jgi:hypothetical protein